MAKGAPVWITRARPGALATAERVRARGFEPLVDPLLAVRFLDAKFELSGVAALAFTSANGVEAFARVCDARDLPVFAVGRTTASRASALGFPDVFSADGDVEALGAMLLARSPGPVLWAGAREPAGDLVGWLNGRGVAARAVAVYETAERDPAPATLSRLAEPTTALLHSPRAARVLARIMASRSGLKPRVLCLSEAVAAPLRDIVDARAVAVAPRPDETALLDLLSR
ncbi:uroporphyrinogen-III synthase [uncultured Caulobacter sp.]|uniref:uroporphyrinogen-III synthase n=1 Tax=uncultured Caulobacter sp. TaxID=158749 RepID=UPI002624ABC7|nr:uroporphyrinogen-III synthase [uncultured Caulobacter sp.]